MNIIRLHSNTIFKNMPRVVTIGAFDGLHLGHQDLIGQLSLQEDKLQKDKLAPLQRTLITFEPLPHEVFMAQAHIARVMQLRDKIRCLQDLDAIDELVIIPFKKDVLAISADDFVQKILIKQLNTKILVIGDDFRFGYKALGDYKLLEAYAKQGYFELIRIESRHLLGERISSTRVRRALANADFAQIKALTGREYNISGRVIHGRKLARTLGFPTLNISLRHRNLPLRGVFNVKAVSLDAQHIEYSGLANIGFRPTVDGVKSMLEVHLLGGITGDFYGKYFSITFLNKIRDEQKFSGIDALKKQIEQDALQANLYAKINKI